MPTVTPPFSGCRRRPAAAAAQAGPGSVRQPEAASFSPLPTGHTDVSHLCCVQRLGPVQCVWHVCAFSFLYAILSPNHNTPVFECGREPLPYDGPVQLVPRPFLDTGDVSSLPPGISLRVGCSRLNASPLAPAPP